MNKIYYQIFISMAIIFTTTTLWSTESPLEQMIENMDAKSSFFDRKMLFQDAQGDEIDLSTIAKDKITVIRFWSSSCPHSRSFDKPMQQMYDHYHPTVAMVDVNSNWKIDVEFTKKIRIDSKMTVPLLFDSNGLLSKAFHAETNAVFLVFNREGILVYKGEYIIHRSDKYGSNILTAADIIDALLDGKPVQPTITRAYGCKILCNPIVKYDELPILLHGSKMVAELRDVGGEGA